MSKIFHSMGFIYIIWIFYPLSKSWGNPYFTYGIVDWTTVCNVALLVLAPYGMGWLAGKFHGR